jgi:hypothetical protein
MSSGCCLDFLLSSMAWICGSIIVVITMMWSESPLSVSGSYSSCWVGSDAIIRSMHDYPVPRANVWMAGGPGWRPFSICQPCISHKAISHGALGPIIGSKLTLGMSVSPICGCKFPILVFQSPHMSDWECYGMALVISSMRSCARSSSIPLLRIFAWGGRYTLPTHIVSPPLTWIPTP